MSLALKIFGTMFVLGFLLSAVAWAMCSQERESITVAEIVGIVGTMMAAAAPIGVVISFIWMML